MSDDECSVGKPYRRSTVLAGVPLCVPYLCSVPCLPLTALPSQSQASSEGHMPSWEVAAPYGRATLQMHRIAKCPVRTECWSGSLVLPALVHTWREQASGARAEDLFKTMSVGWGCSSVWKVTKTTFPPSPASPPTFSWSWWY